LLSNEVTCSQEVLQGLGLDRIRYCQNEKGLVGIITFPRSVDQGAIPVTGIISKI